MNVLKMVLMANRIDNIENKRVKPINPAYVQNQDYNNSVTRFASWQADIVQQYCKDADDTSINEKISTRSNPRLQGQTWDIFKSGKEFYTRKWRGTRSHSGDKTPQDWTRSEPHCDSAGWSM